MEPIYEATGRMTKERYRRFFDINCRVTKQVPIYSICAVVFLLLSVPMWYFVHIATACILVVFAVFLFLFPRLAGKQYASMMEKTAKGQIDLPFTIRFFENEWIEFTPKGETHQRYEDIYRVVETQDAVVIYISTAQGYILYRTDFTRGEAAHLLCFLRFQKRVAYQFI